MKRFLWLALLLLSLLAFGCAHKGGKGDDDIADDEADDSGDDDAGPPCDYAAHDPLIVQGKADLGASRIEEGYAAFHDALALCPESVDARMGLALSCQLQLERQMYSMIQYVIEVVPNFGWKQSKSFGSVIQAILLDHLYPKSLEMLGHARAVQGAPAGWGFFIEKYPFLVDGEFADRVIVDMGGRWDRSDARIIEAEAQAYAGFILWAGSYDLTFDWYWTQHGPDTSGMTLPEKIHAVTGWALDFVGDPNYPMFLLLRGDMGKGFLTQSGLAWGAALTGIPEALAMVRAETGDQSRDVSAYVDENGDGRWNEGEPYRLPYVGTLNPGQELFFEGLLALFKAVGESAWDTGPNDVDPANPNQILLSDLNFILTALGVEPILPEVGFSIGPYFNDPKPEALKEFLRTWLRFFYGATTPGDAATSPLDAEATR